VAAVSNRHASFPIYQKKPGRETCPAFLRCILTANAGRCVAILQLWIFVSPVVAVIQSEKFSTIRLEVVKTDGVPQIEQLACY
jgi:hypothetical protein